MFKHLISNVLRGWQYYCTVYSFRLVFLVGFCVFIVALIKQPLRAIGAANVFDLYSKKPLLTEWERSALKALHGQIPDDCYLCPQVRIADCIRISGANPSVRRQALFKIANKSVDFVVVDKNSGNVRLVIELDDKTHFRKDRRERDALVENLFSHVNIPLRRFRPFEPLKITPKDFSR